MPSGWGGGSAGGEALIQDLNNLGVLTSPVIAGSTSAATNTNATVAQLQTDEQALQTELQTLSSKSGVTATDLTPAPDRQPGARAKLERGRLVAAPAGG